MPDFISTAEVHARLGVGDLVLVDIRDDESYAAGHITGALHLTNQTLPAFLKEAAKERAVAVCCYHGDISQQVVDYLTQQGFAQVYSMNGGFEEWRTKYPEQLGGAGDVGAAA